MKYIDIKYVRKCGGILLLLMVSATSVFAFDIVRPEAEQELVKDADLKDESMSLGLYAGVISFEHFSSGLLYGLSLNVPLNEKLSMDIEAGQAEVSDSEFRQIGLPVFSEQESKADFYSVNVNYHLLPGEAYWSRNKTLLSSIYLLAGAGSVAIDSNNYVALNIGFGIRIKPGRGKTIIFEARDRMIDTDILGTDELTHNAELHAGMSWSF